uniref:CSON000003 protein n=1 Tax=Culicoides sonorensis TaxID=179676 RepID=A0A336MDC7_CULSO
MSHIWYIFLTFISVVNSSVLQLEQKSDLPNLRIVGGRPASPLNTKHQVSLRLKSREKEYGFGYGHLCGGSLIASDLVLTAAHCVFLENSNTLRSAKELVVVMGTMNITVQTTDTLVYSVKNVIVHKRYSAVTVRNDIALLRLSEKVPVNHKTVKPIELTSQETNVGTKCEITGWGAMKNEGSGVYYLQTADILIQEMDVCNSSVSYNGKLKAGMLCAGIYEGGIDSCQGDSDWGILKRIRFEPLSFEKYNQHFDVLQNCKIRING